MFQAELRPTCFSPFPFFFFQKMSNFILNMSGWLTVSGMCAPPAGPGGGERPGEGEVLSTGERPPHLPQRLHAVEEQQLLQHLVQRALHPHQGHAQGGSPAPNKTSSACRWLRQIVCSEFVQSPGAVLEMHAAFKCLFSDNCNDHLSIISLFTLF